MPRPAVFFPVLIGLLLTLQASAQHFSKPCQRYTIRDGLVQQQVRTFLEDSRGYVWIGANSGFSRFDGQTLQAFGPQQGFSGRKIYAFQEAPDGNIWYRTADSVFRFDGRREEALPMTPAFWQSQPPALWPLITLNIRALLGDRFPEIKGLSAAYDLFTDAEGAAVILNWEKRISYRILEQCVSVPFPPGFPDGGPIAVDLTEHYLVVRDQYYTWTENGLQCVARYASAADSVQCLHPRAPGVFHLNANGQIKYWYREGDRYFPIEVPGFNRIDRIWMDSQRRLHFATDEGYGLMYPDGPEWVDSLPARYPWSVLPDGKGELWIGSYRDGLIGLPARGGSPRVLPLPGWDDTHQLFPGTLLGPDGTMLFGGYKGVYYRKSGSLQYFPLGEPIEAFCWDSLRRCYWVAGSRMYGIDPSFQRVQQSISLPAHLAKTDFGLSDLEMSADGSIWAAGYQGVGRVSADGQMLFFDASNGPGYCLLRDDGGQLWLGAQKGLFRWDPATGRFQKAVDYLYNHPVKNLVLLPGRHLAVITDVEVYLLDIRIPEQPLLKGFWSEKNGFQLLEAVHNGACFDGAWLWIPSGKGIQRINLKSFLEQLPLKPLLRLDRVQDERLRFQQTDIETIAQSSSMQVYPEIIHPGADRYSVQYAVNDGPWQWLESPVQGVVRGLQQGQNRLRFRVQVGTLPEAKWPMAAYTITANLPLWERKSVQWTAYALFLLLLMGVGWFLWKAKKEKELKSLLLQSQLSMVQAQLNPHILFNLLSSLQNSIANRGKVEASDHLLRIARLIREVLELSIAPARKARYKFPTIPLDQEIAFLENYLHLESLQCTPPFDYEIRKELKSRLLLPPLLVQPLVENAVIHGIKPNTGKTGRLLIRFQETGAELLITVTDNGKGLSGKEGGRSPLFRYRSRGSELLQERLRLISQLGYPAVCSLSPGEKDGMVAEIRIKKMESGE